MASGPCTNESTTQKLDVSTLGLDGNTPLHEAVQAVQCSNPLDEKHIQYIKLLLKFNPDVNVKNSDGYTPLHLAIKNQRSFSVLEALTKDSEHVFIDIDSVNKKGDAAIHQVLEYSNTDDAIKVLALLIKLKADINKRNSKDETILYLAIAQNSSDLLIKAIIDHGADINATDEQGRTALYHTVSPVTSTYDNSFYSSKFNFSFRDVGIVKHLVEKGAKIEKVAQNGYSPLLLAVVLNKTDYVKAMLENVSNISEGTLEQTTTTFCLEVEYYNIKLHYASYPSSQYYNITSLLISVYDCNKDMAEMLIKAGASVNAVNSSGENALLMITKERNSGKLQEQQEQIAKLLIENGIDLNLKDNSGGTALNYAIRNHKHDIVIHLLEKGLDTL